MQPVDNGQRIVFPNLGRQLEESDVGKYVVRVYPERNSNYQLVWERCFYVGCDLETKQLKLDRIKDGRLCFFTRCPWQTHENNGMWVTVEEVMQHMQRSPQGQALPAPGYERGALEPRPRISNYHRKHDDGNWFGPGSDSDSF